VNREQIIQLFTTIANDLRPAVPADTAAEFSAILFFLKSISDAALPGIKCDVVNGSHDDASDVWSQLRANDNPGRALLDLLYVVQRRVPGLNGLATDSDSSKILVNRPDLCPLLRRSFDRLTPPLPQVSQSDLAEIFQDLLHTLAEHPIGPSTPSPVAKLLVAILNPIPGSSIYDPACGSAGFLCIAAAAVAHGDDRSRVLLAGQEVRNSTALLARIAMMLGGWDGTIVVTNSLVASSERPREKFDYVCTNPPFGLQLATHLDRIPSTSDRRKSVPSEVAFVDHVDRALSKRGRGAVLVPTGFLSRRGYQRDLLKYLVDNDRIEAVVTLPSGLFVGTNIGVAVLILSAAKPSEAKGKIKLISLEGVGVNGLDAKTITDVSGAINNRERVSEKVTVVTQRQVEDQKYDLALSRYVQAEDPTQSAQRGHTDFEIQALLDARDRAEREAAKATKLARKLLTQHHGNV
jgi:type I restriction enzyme M protein